MDFRTTLPFFESPFQINYAEPMLALGSCFAEHIGERLIERKFDLQLNPFGILYNPASLLQALETLRAGTIPDTEALFQHHDLWRHFSFHSRFSHPDRERAYRQMTDSIREATERLPRTHRLILTWGTAYAYRHRKQDRIVANCHKLPAADFERFRLTPEAFLPAYVRLLQEWKKENPNLQVLISVSPVRHLRDGLVENQRSKAVLLLAAEQLCQALDFVHYFPAYELVLDDLRDYRFYDRDLAHPNQLAIDYVWDYFQRACFSPEALDISKAVEPIVRAAGHRPFHQETEAFRQFCKKQLAEIMHLETKYPFLDFQKEKMHFEQII